MIIRVRLFFYVLCSVLLLGCSLRMPQAETMLSQVRAMVDLESKSERQVLWLASFNEVGSVLRPYIVDGYTVFANESGDAVAFDGWVVRSVLGFGSEHALSIADNGWVRVSRIAQKRFSATCSEWQKDALDKGFQWRQICGVNGHETVIHIDETGRIRYIRQAFGGDLGTLTLVLRS